MYIPPEVRAGIFAGESGGDYGALYGYQNRPGRLFDNVNLTSMTLDQWLDFANPSGPYGQYVKLQNNGTVATPMGAYQIVGSTLRDAKKAMGLRGDEVMTPEMQDRVAGWIYETQGTGAWEGYKGPQQGGGYMSTSGQGTTMQEPPKEPDFYERMTKGFLTPDRRDRLIMGLQGMTLNPNQAIMQNASANIADRRDAKRNQEQANRTAEWLRANGQEQLAAAVAGGMMDGKSAVQMALTPPSDERTAMMKNFMFAKEQGYQGTFQDFMNSGGAGGVVVNMPGTGQALPDAPDGMVWATNPDGSPMMEEFDLGGGRKGMRPVPIPLQGTKADQTATDLESGRIAAIDNAQRMLETIDAAIEDPGLASATGKSRPLSFIPSTAGRRANTRIAQLQGQTFLQAYESLKGGGQITEIEGKKAQEAMSRLNDPWIDDKDYLQALNELREVVSSALARAKQRGGSRAKDLTDEELLEIYK